MQAVHGRVYGCAPGRLHKHAGFDQAARAATNPPSQVTRALLHEGALQSALRRWCGAWLRGDAAAAPVAASLLDLSARLVSYDVDRFMQGAFAGDHLHAACDELSSLASLLAAAANSPASPRGATHESWRAQGAAMVVVGTLTQHRHVFAAKASMLIGCACGFVISLMSSAGRRCSEVWALAARACALVHGVCRPECSYSGEAVKLPPGATAHLSDPLFLSALAECIIRLEGVDFYDRWVWGGMAACLVPLCIVRCTCVHACACVSERGRACVGTCACLCIHSHAG